MPANSPAQVSQKRLIQGSLWKMKTSMTGGIKWKQKWVSSDGVVVAHWHSDVLPKKSTPPKHTYVLEKCQVIEVKVSKPYAFKIKDKRSKDEIVFACENITEYAQWLSFLTDDKSIPVSAMPEELSPETRSQSRSPDKTKRDQDPVDQGGDEYLSETISGYDGIEATAEDKINDFFHSHNSHLDKEISIRATEFWDLMKWLEERISIATGRQALSMLTKKPGIIYLKEFLQWWHDRRNTDSKNSISETSNALRSHIGLSAAKKGSNNESQKGVSGAVPMSQLHYVGILDSALAHPEHLSDLLHTSPFVKQKLPSVKNVLTEWSLHSGAGGSWNERLQRSAEAVLDAQSDTYSGEDRQGPSTLLEAYFQYFAVKGQFYAAVRNGVETIVSQYSLPNSMRTVPLVSAIQSDDEAIGDVEGEEVFSLNGIIYRLISVPATSRDLESNSSDVYLRYVTSTDAIKHKMTGNDFRASCAVQRAVSRMIASDAVNGLPICTVMETIVDYGGYRVQALCPIYLEERRTLKYGLASLEDVFICQDLPEPDSGIDYPYQKVFQQLAEKLNLRQRIVRTVVSDQPGNEDIDNVHVYESTEMLLTKDIQFHQSDDNRYYFVNFSNLMPPDVPVPESNDVLTKHFRPEFVSAFHLPLSPEALSVENLPAEGNVESNDEEAAEGNESGTGGGATTRRVSFGDIKDIPTEKERKQTLIAQNIAKLSVESIMVASKKLKGRTIPDAVKKLDNMVVFPIDSYSLTKFIHASGINCRYLGLMYMCSTSFQVKQMLLCEAVARTVKTLLKQVLQQLSRRGKAESQMAEERRRSKESHFEQHQQSLLAAKRAAVVDMFNLVLGTGQNCDEFWTGVLPAAVWSKFGLLIPNNLDRSTIFHAFQLFEAVKYHCGVTFRDSNEYIFHHSTVSEPFQLLDLIAYSPIVKAFHHYPGVDHDLEALTAANMKEKMYGDALNALRIHMSVVVLSQGTHVMDQFLSPKQRVLVAHLTYQIALCHYMLKQYDLCGNVLTAHLQNAPKYTVMSARMQTLLMSSTFFSGGASSGKITAALQYFESGKALYCLTLGSLSPAHGLHACALADLYFMVNAMPQAKVANMIAQSSFQHVLGDMHPVCAAIACKIGNLLIVQKQYSSAVEILEGAFAVYQHINKQTASFANSKELIHVYYVDESHCLHALAVALRGTSEITYAMQCAVLSVDIATADDRPMTPGTVHTLLILAEMYETTSDLFTAVLLYQDVWTIVKANPHVFPMASMLVDLAGRIVCVIVDMLPLQSRTLMDTILVEAEAPVATEWDIAINMLIAELWAQEPVTYIRDTIKKALEEAGETGMFSLSSRLDNLVRTKTSTGIIGVPFCILDEPVSGSYVTEQKAPVPKPLIEPKNSSTPTILKRASSEYEYTQRKSQFLARTSSAPQHSGDGVTIETNELREEGLKPVGIVTFQGLQETIKEDMGANNYLEDQEKKSAGLELTLNLKLRALLKLSNRDGNNRRRYY